MIDSPLQLYPPVGSGARGGSKPGGCWGASRGGGDVAKVMVVG